MAHFETYPDAAGDRRFRLVADNGENVHASEGYRDETDTVRGIEDLVRAVLSARTSTTLPAAGRRLKLDIRSVDG